MPIKFVFVPPQNEITRDWVTRLSEATPEVTFIAPETVDEAKREIVDAEAAFGTLRPDVLSAASNLRWLQAPAAAPPAGYYYPELIDHPVTVTNFRDIYNDHISVHILAIMLSFTKHLQLYRDQQTHSQWRRLEGAAYNTIFLPDSTALIVGVGGIGGETARLCKALGMRVLGVDARREDRPGYLDGMSGPEALDALLPEADFVIVTVPHTPQTEGLFDATKFGLMKDSAIFINIGRGMTTRLDDLNEALRRGQIGGAGLDVYEIEPLPPDHPLWDAPNTILTPHVAAQGSQYLAERRYGIVLENVQHLLRNEPLRNVVDKRSWF